MRSAAVRIKTIKDVAKKAGVSIATVSRVVNKNYYVSPGIEQKVRDAIEATGYYPDSIARSLKSKATQTIAFIVSDISNIHFMFMARAIEDVVSRKTYNIIACSTEDDKNRELAYLETLISKKIDGLIINTTGKNNGFISAISQHLPVVAVNRRIRDPGYRGDFVDTHNVKGAYDLTRHVIEFGHRRIAVINGPQELSTGVERFQGFKKALVESGVELPVEYVFEGDFRDRSGFEGSKTLMRLTNRPTAIIAMNNNMAIGALKFLRPSGVRIPQDVSLAAYGNIENIELMYVQPTHVTQDPYMIGTRAGEMIIERIITRSLLPREVILEPHLVTGSSVQEPAGNSS
jgi:LacI family transcriptional regulator